MAAGPAERPKIELSGEPYEVKTVHCSDVPDSLIGKTQQIGLRHGQYLQTQILKQCDIYRNLFLENCKFEWTQVREIAKEFHQSVKELAPDLLEEMRGIADGVDGVDILDIIALNARSEIALGQWDDGCTSLAWTSNPPRKQILAQNWGWRPSVGENLALVSIRQQGKPHIWMVTEVRHSNSFVPLDKAFA